MKKTHPGIFIVDNNKIVLFSFQWQLVCGKPPKSPIKFPSYDPSIYPNVYQLHLCQYQFIFHSCSRIVWPEASKDKVVIQIT
jgi:hypothetical protein